ncbi:DNA-3-methyladenine glycosylase family protein [Pseudoclavibacter helvolus]|uniref:3-methyladenine DNA glycosylase/8-oxoguanine DNA glycosylase n=1 Tax=Pseudoclavibacter helvolus TaxID=255205 RepID=A0A7W4URG4_9MICO|nr:DNA-3-methyladenine glycosylase 2 family protein [Pseudoclavibacter helvolus]MBB2959274.1 3-methyladenine DNA glycosylase/8-oxoguanine DNA glycosylase [Pseudoclavibacter helvolus]
MPDRVMSLYRPALPVDVLQTLAPLMRGRRDPTCWVDPVSRDVWRTSHALAGGATTVFRQAREGIRIVSWGEASEIAVDEAPVLLGRDDDWGELRLEALPELADVRRRNEGLRLPKTGAVFEALSAAIIEQKITGLEAHRAWDILHRDYADAAPGPAGLVPRHLRLPLTPGQWRRIPSWDWHRAGVDHSRTGTVIRSATVASTLERTSSMPTGSEEPLRRLRSIVGVGVWTANETVQRSHGDPDAPSFSDYHIPNMVGWALAGCDVDDDGMRELLEPWRGHRERVVRLIKLAGNSRPKHGARMTVQDHRFH